LVDGVERKVGYVPHAALSDPEVDVRGALCFPPEGLPLFSDLRIRNIMIDGPKPIAKLACRPGPLTPERIEELWQQLGRALPQA
jgi:hypothetical protein